MKEAVVATHSLLRDKSRTMNFRPNAKARAMLSRTIFLRNVCPFVSAKASPKHPQSGTGFSQYTHAVRAVMKVMTTGPT